MDWSVFCGARGGVPAYYISGFKKSKTLHGLECLLWGERGSNPHDVTIDGF